MADYGGSFNDPTLGYYGLVNPGMNGAAPPYLPLSQTDQPGNDVQGFATPPNLPPPGPPASPTPPVTNPLGPNPIVNSTGIKNTSPNGFTPPSGVPDQKNPGYDTTGYLIGSTYDASTGTLKIKRPDGSYAITHVDPKTGAANTSGGGGTNPFGVQNQAAPPPPTPPGGGITNPSFYTPFTQQAPVFTKPPAFRAPTLEEASAQPGYQFGLQQGEQALQQSAAAKGLLRTGGTLKGILDYGRNAATQNYSNVLAQQLGVYNTNLATQYQQPFDAAFRSYQAEQDAFRANQEDPFSKYLRLLQLSNPNV